VSVCGTVAIRLEPNEAFLGTWSRQLSGSRGALDPGFSLNDERICLSISLYQLNWISITSPAYPNASPHGI